MGAGPAVVMAADGADRLDVSADPGALDRAARVAYRIRQRFAYTYDGPAYDLVHRLVAVPPRRHGDQVLRSADVTASDPAATLAWERLPDGGRAARLALAAVSDRLVFDVTAVVDRFSGRGGPTLPASAMTGRRLLAPTTLTTPDTAMRAVARSLAAEGDPLTTARRCSRWVHERIAYVTGSTGVSTTAAQAVAGGVGVCQDHAHVMLALCRAAGVPARYVSGHLLGQGGTHAWVEVVVPDRAADGGAVAVALDPCHDRAADRRYVTVAVGRDYADVAPTSGHYRGPGRGALVATKQVDVIELADR